MAEPVGRPTIVTPDILAKLEYAFALGCTDLEACFYANISKSTLYNYQEKHPEFVERKEELKERPIFIAREAVVNGLQTDPKLSLSYLERKKNKEFALRAEQKNEGTISIDLSEKAKELLNKYKKDESQPSSGELAQ